MKDRTANPDLTVDPARTWLTETGIYVRATLRGKWGSYDIVSLDRHSLFAWLRSRDGQNYLAENVVGILLGHGSIANADGSYRPPDQEKKP